MRTIFFLPLLFLLCSCAVSKRYDPYKKFSPEQLQKDYEIFKNSLEESHPSLYWYTPKDSVDYYFEIGKSKLHDSLPEYKFRNVLSYVLAQIHCGHTSVRASKEATKYAERIRSFAFPLSVKTWEDTTVITANLNRKDTNAVRGTLLVSIEGKPVREVIDSFFRHLSADGYNLTHKYQTLSNGGTFRSMYGSIYGLRSKMKVEYMDSSGLIKTDTVAVYDPRLDTPRGRPFLPRPTKKQRRKMSVLSQRNLKIDAASNTGVMEVNTFAKNNKLRSFFRKSFRELRKKKIKNLVVDIRGNGGGNVTLSNLLTKYLADHPFKVADSLYAINNKSHYKKYEENYFLNRLFFIFMANRKKDGRYHFTYFENKYFKPKKRNHFHGDAYILTGGNTFSAASLFAKALKEQEDVTIVGEETGGGAYGNTAWLIPDMTLPNTKVRFRLPLFRLVIDKNEHKGRGIIPEVEVAPTVEAIRRNADFKMEKVMDLIKERSTKK